MQKESHRWGNDSEVERRSATNCTLVHVPILSVFLHARRIGRAPDFCQVIESHLQKGPFIVKRQEPKKISSGWPTNDTPTRYRDLIHEQIPDDESIWFAVFLLAVRVWNEYAISRLFPFLNTLSRLPLNDLQEFQSSGTFHSFWKVCFSSLFSPIFSFFLFLSLSLFFLLFVVLNKIGIKLTRSLERCSVCLKEKNRSIMIVRNWKNLAVKRYWILFYSNLKDVRKFFKKKHHEF